MKRYRSPMRFPDGPGPAGDGAEGGSAPKPRDDGGGTPGKGADPDDSGGGKGNKEAVVLRRKLEKEQREREKLEQDLKALREQQLSDDERKRKEEIESAYERGKSENAALVREAELRGEVRAVMSEHGIPSKFYASFRESLGEDLEDPKDVADAAKSLIESDPVWGGFGRESSGGSGGFGGPRRKPAAGGEPNPWSKQHWNVTRQVELMEEDPARAKTLMGAAE